MHPRRRHSVVVVALLAAASLTACGSQLDPNEVSSAGGGTGQTGTQAGDLSGAGVAGDDTQTSTGGDATGSTAGAVGATGADTGSGPTGGGDPGGGAGAGDTQGQGANAADGGTKAGSCDGFKNGTGITDDKIVLGNASDISGPVPGIFESAQQATRAYAAYFNSTGDICGRKLEVSLYDSRSDAAANQQAYAKACSEVFAMVGSMSAFDSGGVSEAQGCGLPDLRSTSVTPERTKCSTCFSTQAVAVNLMSDAVPKYFEGSKFGDAADHVGMLYINAGAAAPNAASFRAGWTKAGWKIDVFAGIDVSEFNYSSYVQQLKDNGVKLVVYLGPYQNTVKLQQAMQQQGYKPDVFLQDATIYDENYVEQAGSLGNGTYVYSSTALFDDFKNKEMALYRSWLDQVSPGAVPNYYGLYAWSAARLFVQRATALGGKLDRASLVASLQGVKDWTSNGLHVPQQVGAKRTYNCVSIIQLNGGRWSTVSGAKPMCGNLIDSGVGG